IPPCGSVERLLAQSLPLPDTGALIEEGDEPVRSCYSVLHPACSFDFSVLFTKNKPLVCCVFIERQPSMERCQLMMSTFQTLRLHGYKQNFSGRLQEDLMLGLCLSSVFIASASLNQQQSARQRDNRVFPLLFVVMLLDVTLMSAAQ
ncbi:hypothetical protein INR49_030862, partial [Caranx melampygus]